MKHRNKFLAALVLGVLGLSACNFSIPSEFFSTPSSESPSSSETSSVLGSSSNSESSRNPEIEAIYNLYFKTATEAGITPLSYQEWLASLNGVVIDDTHVPVIGVNSDGYWTIDGVSTGVKATGNEGIHGKDNVTYYTGVNAPENSLGQVGDLYVNTTNWSYYAKGNNGWELKGSLLSGGSSQNTNTIRVASGEPDALLGQVGDVYINTDNWNFYVKSSNGWELKGNLQRELEVKWSVTIVPSEHGSITANVTSATAGTEVVFTIRPDNDYYLSDLEVNNVSVIASVAGNTYTTKMVENGLTVKGTFKTGQVQPHVHEYKTTYDYDTNGHWRECVAGDARTDEGPHEYNDWVIDVPATATTKGHQYRVCKVCSYKQEQDIEPTSHTHTSDKWSSNDTTHYHVCSGCGEMYDIAAHTFVQVTRVEPSNGQDGYLVEKCSVCSYEHRVTLPAAQQDIKIFATNDIHGQIYQETAVGDDGSAYVARNDIAKYMTFLKNQKAQGNTLLLDQGDTWQGSIYSNYNHGGLLTDLMNYVQFSARTVGNHDFDWGVEPIITNAHKNYNGYTTPTLAANVYDYNFATKTEGRNQQSQIGIPTITYNVSGVKVGVIGTIGSDQITSICTNNVKDICFKDHIQIIKQEAQRLRNEEKCDIVVLSHHGDQDDLTNQNLNQFINVALCAHSHQWEHCTEGELVYVQGRSNNRHVWQLNLPYSISSHTLGEIDYASISASYIDRNVTTVDTTIAKLVNDNYTACLAQEPLDEIIANNVSGFFGQGEELANLMADAIYEQAKSEGYDIYCSYVNNARHDINATSWTYADIFEAFPFENEVYIMDVSGKDFINEINNYNYVRKDMSKWPSNNEFDLNATYRIAVIDYLGVHSNARRYYDYFPSCNGESVATLSKKYRSIVVDYLKNHNYNKGTLLDSSNFSSSLSQFKRWGCATAKKYTITFMYNYEGMNEFAYSSGPASQGTPYSSTYPPAPEREGYRFTGWYFDTACTQPVTGVVSEDKVLYAGWEQVDSADEYVVKLELSDLSNGAGGYLYGQQTMWLNASNGTSSINVYAAFENAKYNADYNEFGLGSYSGLEFTLPSGYVISSYTFKAYKYNNLLLYADATKAVSYSYQEPSLSGNVMTFVGSGLNYPSLYCYNNYSGNYWFYSMEFVIVSAS